MTVVQEALPQTEVAVPERARGRGRLTVGVFAVTAFLGASLLFLAEPMVAKLLLPDFGGSATVWSTSSLFFQCLLLVAYAYCHVATSRLGRRGQPAVHVLVLALPVVTLPLVLPDDAAPGPGDAPALWLLRTLAVLVGLPFVVVATTGPLLQRWYSWTAGDRADDPYFLFAASNLGSFVGLLAYPFLVEPHLSLASQRAWWSWGYAAFAALVAACGLLSWARGRPAGPVRLTGRAAPLSRTRVVRWGLLAFLPSTLLLGVTAHVSTDVAAIPLLWVMPLAVYLGSFVVAFARSTRVPPHTATRVAVASALGELMLLGSPAPIGLSVASGLVTLALVAYAAHARLAVDRPGPEHLTVFYLVISVGGALGGLVNGLIAPALFPSVVEYPLALVAVPFLLLGLERRGGRPGFLTANRVRAACAALAVGTGFLGLRSLLTSSEVGLLMCAAVVAIVLLCGWWLSRSPVMLLVVALVLPISVALAGANDRIEESRTFYGTYRVFDQGGMHRLVHGTTVHGTQYVARPLRDQPTTYYARSGPLNDVFRAFEEAGGRDVAVVGLGAGTVAAYGQPGESFTFFEIDPEVVRIAEDPRFFTYLSDSRARVRTVTGDGRLNLARQEPGTYDLILLDAFSSDAIPVHLLTEQAVEEYVSRLRPGGLLVFHISNRAFDLRPVLAATSESLDLHAAVGTSTATTDGAAPTQWVALEPRRRRDRPAAGRSSLWSPLDPDRRVRWTDDYSSVLSVLR